MPLCVTWLGRYGDASRDPAPLNGEATEMSTLRLVALAAVAANLLSAPAATRAAEPNDDAALAGVKSAKALFDVSVSDKRQLVLYLNVIKDARDTMVKKGIKPDLIVMVRGAAVSLIGRTAGSAEQQAVTDQIGKLVSELAAQGVRFEACNYAMKVLKVDAGGLLPGFKVVANTFNSAVGYQAKGYGVVTVF